MIARRKRMLQTFLNRVARHPILSNEHVFHRFLDGEVSWVSSMSICTVCPRVTRGLPWTPVRNSTLSSDLKHPEKCP